MARIFEELFTHLIMQKFHTGYANWCRLCVTWSGWLHSIFMHLKNGKWINNFRHTHTHTHISQAEGPVGVTGWLWEGNITVHGSGGSVDISTMGWTVRDRIPVRTRFSARPDRPWGLPSLLYNAYRVFPGVKATGACCWPLTPF